MNSISDLVYDISLILMRVQWQLVTAESCTGGLVASQLTDIPGSSLWFERGYVTYSNRAKQDMLDVPEELIVNYGAVSEQVALAMAVGALKKSAGHIALSVTGIAGPNGGSLDKPVGTVWFGWAAQGIRPKTSKKLFPGDRHEIRLAACQYALEGVLLMMQEIEAR